MLDAFHSDGKIPLESDRWYACTVYAYQWCVGSLQPEMWKFAKPLLCNSFAKGHPIEVNTPPQNWYGSQNFRTKRSLKVPKHGYMTKMRYFVKTAEKTYF